MSKFANVTVKSRQSVQSVKIPSNAPSQNDASSLELQEFMYLLCLSAVSSPFLGFQHPRQKSFAKNKGMILFCQFWKVNRTRKDAASVVFVVDLSSSVFLIITVRALCGAVLESSDWSERAGGGAVHAHYT